MDDVAVAKLLAMFLLLICSLVASFTPYKVAALLKRWDQRQREKERAERALQRKQHEGNGTSVNYTEETGVVMEIKPAGDPETDDTKIPKSERIISMMICFSGGVLLATAMVHMLPEVRTDVLHGIAAGKLVNTKLPIAEMIFCAGFLAVYFIERLVRYLVKRRDSKMLKKLTVAIQPSVLPHGTGDSGRVYNNAHQDSSSKAQQDGNSAAAPVDPEAQPVGHDSLGKKLGHFFIILALSFHSIFEGLAIGLQDKSNSVWLLFLGVGTHKFLIAFCIGMELFTSGTQSLKMASGYLITFAVMSPIGIAMGLGVTEEIANDPGTQAAVVGVLQGLAGGTLVYVTFFELLNEQGEKVKSMPAIYSFLEWFTFAAGFCAMTTIDSAASLSDPSLGATWGPHNPTEASTIA